MQARTLLNVFLAVAVAGAAAALYTLSRPSAEDGHALVPVASESLRRIEIRRLQQPAIVLERTEGEWRMTAPYTARLDEIALGRILDLARLRVQTPLAAGDRARFELDKPWATIGFDGHAVEFGATNVLTQELYLASGERVYAVPARLAAAVPSVPAKLLAHRLLGADEIPIAVRTPRYSVVQDNARWRLDPDDPGLSQDDLVRWIDQWRHAGSVITQPASDAASEERIEVELRGGRTITFTVVQRSPDLVLLRSDESLAYHLPAQIGAALLTRPNAAPSTSTARP